MVENDNLFTDERVDAPLNTENGNEKKGLGREVSLFSSEDVSQWTTEENPFTNATIDSLTAQLNEEEPGQVPYTGASSVEEENLYTEAA